MSEEQNKMSGVPQGIVLASIPLIMMISAVEAKNQKWYFEKYFELSYQRY